MECRKLTYQNYNFLEVVHSEKRVPEIKKCINYYPFGLKHSGYNDQITGRKHKYGFGGKEFQDDLYLDWYDVTARNYDPALGRWMNLDPLAVTMRRHSPYNFGFDNPIFWTDPDGMAPEHIGLDKNLTKEQRAEVMSNLQKLTDDKLSYNSETNKVEISGTNDSGDKSSGTGLIRSLVNHDKNVTITTDGSLSGSSEESVNETTASNGEGSDSVVTLGGLHKVLVEKNGKVSAEMLTKDLALGHELSHSLATMDGVSKPLTDTYSNTFTNRHGATETERQPKEEYYATGIYNRPASSSRGSYPSENSLRADRNLGKRVSYGSGRILPKKKKK